MDFSRNVMAQPDGEFLRVTSENNSGVNDHPGDDSGRPAGITRRETLHLLCLAAVNWALPITAEGAGIAKQPESIHLDNLPASGIYPVLLDNAEPNLHGVHARVQIQVSDVDKAVCYSSAWWPAGGNRTYPFVSEKPGNFAQGGIFMLIRKQSGDYIALLPLANKDAFAWLSCDASQLSVQLGTLGNGPLSGRKNVIAWVRSRSAYAAIAKAWEIAAAQSEPGTMLPRGRKNYPEIFRYLGWCSWEAYKAEIDEAKMIAAVREIERSGIPVRYFLMDEGHADPQTLLPDPVKFPRGYQPLTALRKPEKIRWFGLWWAFLGRAHGVTAPGKLGALSDHTMNTGDGVLIPKPAEPDIRAFYDFLLKQTTDGNFDFVKTDFMVDPLPLYAGLKTEVPTLGGLPPDNKNAIPNPFRAAALMAKVWQTRAAAKMNGMMNCNWHNAACVFNSGQSVVGRCSEDYQANNLESAKKHLYHAFSAIPWLGQIAWGDHDMFHSGDRVAAYPMSISKALSGGPIYLSDLPSDFVSSTIRPLCLKDGSLLRPLAPGSPVEEDIFYIPGEGKLFRATAPLANRSVAAGVYHLEAGNVTAGELFKTAITMEHYQKASGMLQPYPGDWTVPEEGVVIYNWKARRALRLQDSFEVSLSEFGCVLLQMSPIHSGWSVIGNMDKYLSAATFADAHFSKNEVSFRIAEPGHYAVWCENGPPSRNGKPLSEIATNFYVADLSANDPNAEVTLQCAR